jgi:hypothetical protein
MKTQFSCQKMAKLRVPGKPEVAGGDVLRTRMTRSWTPFVTYVTFERFRLLTDLTAAESLGQRVFEDSTVRRV